MAAKKSASGWADFPHDAKAYAHAGEALKKAWPKLHAGDCEPFPDAKRAAALLKAAGKAAPKLDADALSTALQDAWRSHASRAALPRLSVAQEPRELRGFELTRCRSTEQMPSRSTESANAPDSQPRHAKQST